MNIKNEVIETDLNKKIIVIDEYDFEDIAAEFINCEEYMRLSEETHHGITRLKHSFKVAKTTYQVSKSFGLDYVSATRAAFLHDFFFNEELPKDIGSLEKAKKHPEFAVINSKKYFNLNKKEEDAILNHMYPLTPSKPETLEGVTLSLVDKGVAISDKITVLYKHTKSLVRKIHLFIF